MTHLIHHQGCGEARCSTASAPAKKGSVRDGGGAGSISAAGHSRQPCYHCCSRHCPTPSRIQKHSVRRPFDRSDQKLVKHVQRMTKLILEVRHLPYHGRLRVLNLPSLCYHSSGAGHIIAVIQLFRSGLDLDPRAFFDIELPRVTKGADVETLELHVA